jgi:hypothetical protein
VDWARLPSSLVACNLGCNPRCENKVLVPILFLIGGFHLDHLYKCHVNLDVTLCMITPSMNKCMFTFVNTIVTLLHCVYLMQSLHHNLLDVCKYLVMQSSIWQMVCIRTSEESIHEIPNGSVGHGRGQVPCGGAPPPPPISLEQLLDMQNDLMRRLVENDECGGAEHQQPDINRGILRTRIFWQLTHQPLPLRPTPWRWTAGSAPRSRSLDYFTVQSIKRLHTLCSRSEVQLEHGGLPTSPPYLMITMFHGVNSILPSVHTTYLRVCSAAS